MQHRVEQLTTLLEISRHIGAILDLKTLLTHIDLAARQVLECERVTVFLYDAEREELYSTFATGTEEIRFSSKEGLAGEALQTGTTINIPDAYADPRFNPAIDQDTGFRTRNLLSVPMQGYEGEVVAVLQLINKHGGEFTTEDEELASTLGSLTGVAVQRQMLLDAYAVKQKIERDLAVARDIQRSLLPNADPQIEGFDIAGWNKSADETGGDVYDFILLPDGRLGILLADASGHGIGPALVAAECRAMIRALFTTTENLNTILTQTNAILNQDLISGRFITVFLGILDPGTGTIEYVSGGHAPLLYYSQASGEERTMDATTLPLGILSSIDGTPAEPLVMQRGDVLILVTDGFNEWKNLSEEEFGTDRIFAVVRQGQDRSATEIIKAMHEEVVTYAEGIVQDDDLTAILIKKV